MSTRLYSLPGGDGNETKVLYLLGLGMGMRINFFYGDRYEIVKLVPRPTYCHPYSYLHLKHNPQLLLFNVVT